MDTIEIIVCVVFCLVVIYILTIMICRALYPFWYSMPMWHTFDLHRHALVWRPTLVDTEPHKNPPHPHYYAPAPRIETKAWSDFTPKERATVLDLVQNFYGTTSETFQAMTAAELDSLLAGPSYVSLLRDTQKTHYDSTVGWIPETRVVACIASHSYRLLLREKHYRIYYVDLMAGPTEPQKLVYSHIYNQQRENSNIAITLFKKTGEPIRGCRDFLRFPTFFYDMTCIPWRPPEARMRITLVGDREGLRHVLENPRLSSFAVILVGDLEYAWQQVEAGRWVIGILWEPPVAAAAAAAEMTSGMSMEQPLAYYFFSRDTVEWSQFGDRKSLRAMSAFAFRAITDELFFAAFGSIVRKICAATNSGLGGLLEIDEVGDLDRILQHIAGVLPPWRVQDNFYYFYNFLYPGRVSPRESFILM